LAMVVESPLPGALKSVAAGLPDGFAATGVLVVGSHVSDRFVQPRGIVFRSDSDKFGFQQRRLGDGLQVRPLTLNVAEERFDPRLVLGHAMDRTTICPVPQGLSPTAPRSWST
jgi:hypothetical protein